MGVFWPNQKNGRIRFPLPEMGNPARETSARVVQTSSVQMQYKGAGRPTARRTCPPPTLSAARGVSTLSKSGEFDDQAFIAMKCGALSA